MKTTKQSKHLNATLILQRLPVHRQLSLSQSVLAKCAPIWQQWATQNLVAESINAISLSHFHAGELIIHCESAIYATQIKQQHKTLLNFFQTQGMAEIEQITVRLANNPRSTNHSSSDNTSNTEATKHLNVEAISSNQEPKKLSDYTLNSIKSAQKSTTSQALSESLIRLIDTIEKT